MEILQDSLRRRVTQPPHGFPWQDTRNGKEHGAKLDRHKTRQRTTGETIQSEGERQHLRQRFSSRRNITTIYLRPQSPLCECSVPDTQKNEEGRVHWTNGAERPETTSDQGTLPALPEDQNLNVEGRLTTKSSIPRLYSPCLPRSLESAPSRRRRVPNGTICDISVVEIKSQVVSSRMAMTSRGSNRDTAALVIDQTGIQKTHADFRALI